MNLAAEFRRFFKPPAGDAVFQLNGLGVEEWMSPGLVHRPGGTGDRLLMAFPAGVEVGTAGGIVRLREDAVMLWENGAGHFYGCGETRWRHSWLHFSGEIAPLIARRHITAGIHPLDYTCAKERISALAAEFGRGRPPQPAVLQNLFDNLLCEINRPRTPAVPDNLAAARRRIEREFRRALPLEELAAEAGWSVSHFSAEFRRWFGVSPGAYRLELAMSEAKYLLRNTNLSIKEVALSLGFRDVFYFSRLFRRKCGIAPGTYRHNAGAVPENP